MLLNLVKLRDTRSLAIFSTVKTIWYLVLHANHYVAFLLVLLAMLKKKKKKHHGFAFIAALPTAVSSDKTSLAIEPDHWHFLSLLVYFSPQYICFGPEKS